MVANLRLPLAGPTSAAQWYDGGDSLAYPTCEPTSDSPASRYKEFEFPYGAQIIDHGARVEVKAEGSVGMSFFYFRSKKACLKYVAERKRQDEAEQRQEKERLDPYR
jgi:hypothetical protein